MLPNGGFPPMKKCEEETKNNKKSKDEKGFFYTTNTNITNIREILKKKSNLDVVNSRQEDELEIVDSI